MIPQSSKDYFRSPEGEAASVIREPDEPEEKGSISSSEAIRRQEALAAAQLRADEAAGHAEQVQWKKKLDSKLFNN